METVNVANTRESKKMSLCEKYNITLEELDFRYIENCKDSKKMEAILRILRSGEEGTYPELTKFAEDRLRYLHPKSRLLRKEGRLLNQYDLEKTEQIKLTKDVEEWISDIKQSERNLKDLSSGPRPNNPRDIPPVRQSAENKTNCLEKTKSTTSRSKNRISSCDYASWDKFDVDTELQKMDTEEEKNKEKAETEERVQKKEKVKIRQKMVEEVSRKKESLTEFEKKHLANREREKGNECFRSGDFMESAVFYTRSIALFPTVEAYNNRALTHLKVKKYGAAALDCNQALRLQPGNTKALYRRAMAYSEKKDWVQAINDVQQVIDLEPDNKEAKNLLENIQKQMMKGAGLSEENKRKKGRRMLIEEIESVPEEQNLREICDKKTQEKKLTETMIDLDGIDAGNTVTENGISSKECDLFNNERCEAQDDKITTLENSYLLETESKSLITQMCNAERDSKQHIDKLLPGDVKTGEDIPEKVYINNIDKDIPEKVRTNTVDEDIPKEVCIVKIGEDIPEAVCINKIGEDFPEKVCINKGIPEEVCIRKNIIEEVYVSKDIPEEVYIKKDVPRNIDISKGITEDVSNDMPEEIHISKDFPEELHMSNNIPDEHSGDTALASPSEATVGSEGSTEAAPEVSQENSVENERLSDFEVNMSLSDFPVVDTPALPSYIQVAQKYTRTGCCTKEIPVIRWMKDWRCEEKLGWSEKELQGDMRMQEAKDVLFLEGDNTSLIQEFDSPASGDGTTKSKMSPFEFLKSWHAASRCEPLASIRRARLLVKVAHDFAEVLSFHLDGPMLSRIIQTLKENTTTIPLGTIYTILQNLSRALRFNVVVMFLSEEDKNELKRLFSLLEIGGLSVHFLAHTYSIESF